VKSCRSKRNLENSRKDNIGEPYLFSRLNLKNPKHPNKIPNLSISERKKQSDIAAAREKCSKQEKKRIKKLHKTAAQESKREGRKSAAIIAGIGSAAGRGAHGAGPEPGSQRRRGWSPRRSMRLGTGLRGRRRGDGGGGRRTHEGRGANVLTPRIWQKRSRCGEAPIISC